MDKQSKILITLFVALVLGLSGFEYRQIVVKHDFVVKAHTACDESANSCFQTTCAEEDGPDCEPEIYAKITKNVSNTELCNQYKDDCPDLTCSTGEAGCEITYCSKDELDSGEKCIGPIPKTEDPLTTDDASSTDSVDQKTQ